MPGLADCFGCGRSLSEEAPAAPAAFAPRVRAANPLARRLPVARRPRLRALREVLSIVADGLVPGRAARRQGETTLGTVLAGAAALGLIIGVLTLGSPYTGWGQLLFASAVLTSVATETHRRTWYPAPWGALIGGLFAAAAVLLLRFGSLWAFRLAVPQVTIPHTERLAGGVYLTAPVASVPDRDTLCVTPLERGFGPLTRERLLVGPVLALPGETVENDGYEILVDGQRTGIVPINAGVAWTREPLVVPNGHVVLYAHPLTAVPIEAVRELTWRWAPSYAAGPVAWPPQETP